MCELFFVERIICLSVFLNVFLCVCDFFSKLKSFSASKKKG